MCEEFFRERKNGRQSTFDGLVETNDSTGILHRDAMERTVLTDEAATVDTDNLVVGEGLLEGTARGFVVVGLGVGGKEHRAIHDEEVGVGSR